jgi:putative endonuclease
MHLLHDPGWRCQGCGFWRGRMLHVSLRLEPVGGIRYARGMVARWFQSLFKGGVFKSLPQRDVLGDRGENLAARFLRNLGYKIIIRNFRCELGEIDIIARDGDTLVFVEVKTRAYDDPAPEDQVNTVKQHQLTKVARSYLGRYGFPQPPARFDVVAVVWPEGRPPIIRHTPHAFEATF